MIKHIWLSGLVLLLLVVAGGNIRAIEPEGTAAGNPQKTAISESDADELWQKIEYIKKDENKRAEAIKLLQEFERKFPSDKRAPESIYEQAEILRKAYKIPEALSCYKRLLADFPQSEFAPKGLFWVAEYTYRRGKQDEALKYYEQLIAGYPKDVLVERTNQFIKYIKQEKKEDIGLLKKIYLNLNWTLATLSEQSFLINVRIETKGPFPFNQVQVAYKSPHFFVSFAKDKEILGSILYDGTVCNIYLADKLNTVYYFTQALPELPGGITALLQADESDNLGWQLGYGMQSTKRGFLERVKSADTSVLTKLHYGVTLEKQEYAFTMQAGSGEDTRIIITTTPELLFKRASVITEETKIQAENIPLTKPIPELFQSQLNKDTKKTEITLDNLVEAMKSVYDTYQDKLPANPTEKIDKILSDEEAFTLLLQAGESALKTVRENTTTERLVKAIESFYEYTEKNINRIKDRVIRKEIEENILGPANKRLVLGYIQLVEQLLSPGTKVYENKIKELTDSIAKDPKDIALLLERSEIYQILPDKESALEDLNRIIKLEPNNDEAYARLGVLFLWWKMPYEEKHTEYLEKAQKYLEKSLDLNKSNPLALTAMGELTFHKMSLEKGELTEALKARFQQEVEKSYQYYIKVINSKEDFLPAYISLANLFGRFGQPDKTIGVLKKAKEEINEKSPEQNVSAIYVNLAMAYAGINQLEKAVKELDEFINKYPQYPQLYGIKIQSIALKMKMAELKPPDPALVKEIEKQEQELLTKIATAPDDRVNIGEAALVLARSVDAKIDTKDYLAELDNIATELKSRIKEEKSPEKIIRIINDYLFTDRKAVVSLSSDKKSSVKLWGVWAISDKSSFLTTVLDSMDGNCLGFTTLYLALAERLNLPFYGVILPGHVFVRYDDGKTRRNIETTQQGKEISSKAAAASREGKEEYLKWLKEGMPDVSEEWLKEELKKGKFFQNLSKKEAVSLILMNRAYFYLSADRTDKAIESFERCLKLNPPAQTDYIQYRLGGLYDQLKQYDKALPIWKKLAEQGLAGAQVVLGNYYMYGQGIDKDLKEAFKWYRKSAEQGFAEAQHNLGVCYDEGFGVAKDLKEAVEWFRKSAENGFAPAQHNLGSCYREGSGVEKDLKEAAGWFRKAAEKGFAQAQYNLGVCYYKGEGVEKDEKEAVRWFTKAAEQGDEKARELVSKLRQREAVNELVKQAESGNAEAQCKLGKCFLSGEGVDKDRKEAAKWFTKSAEQGFAEAQYRLGICYFEGYGVKQDKQTAIEWLKKSAQVGYQEAIDILEILEKK